MFQIEEINFILNNAEFYSIIDVLLENTKRIIQLSSEKNYLQTAKRCLCTKTFSKNIGIINSSFNSNVNQSSRLPEVSYSKEYKTINVKLFIKDNEDNSEIINKSFENEDLSNKLDEIFLIIREKIFSIKDNFNKLIDSNSSIKNRISSTIPTLFVHLTNINKRLDKNIYDVKLLCSTFAKIAHKNDFLNKNILTLYMMVIESTLSAMRQIKLEIDALFQICNSILSNFDLIYKLYRKNVNNSIVNELREIANIDINNAEFAISKSNQALQLLRGPYEALTSEEYEYEMSLLGV